MFTAKIDLLFCCLKKLIARTVISFLKSHNTLKKCSTVMIYHFEVFEQAGGADFTIRRHIMPYLQFKQQPSGQSFGTRLKENQKAVFLCEKESSALPEYACQNNQTVRWNN